MPSEALGLLEVKGLVALMEGTDAMLKAANVEMIGWDKAGSGLVTCFVKGDVAAVKAAVDAGAEAAGRIGTVVSVHVIARPHDELGGMYPKAKKPAAAAPAGGRLAEVAKK
jgi:ethanolamine utilization protein EutM